MENEIQETKRNNNLSNTISSFLSLHLKDSALLILILTALSYLSAGSYKMGYLAYYGLPFTLTTIETNDIILVAIKLLLLIGVLIIFYFVLNLSYKSGLLEKIFYLPLSIPKNIFTDIMIKVFYYGLVSTFIIQISGNYLFDYSLPKYISYAIYILLAINFSLLHFQEWYRNMVKNMKSDFSLKVIVTILTIVFVIGVNYFGDNTAKNQTKYLTVEQNSQKYIVLMHSKENVTVAPLHQDNRSIIPNYKTLKLNETTELITMNFPEGISVQEPKNIE